MISSPNHSIVARQKLIALQEPIVMGIINFSQDSFYTSSTVKTNSNLLKKVETQVTEGALIVDLGAMSSRPGSDYTSLEIELELFRKFLPSIVSEFPNVVFSIDTHRSETARYCLEEGAAIINDITAGTGDKDLLDLVAHYQVPYIAMHMQKSPSVMQDNPQYDNVVLEVLDYLIEKLALYREKGIHDVIIDPGFGFGKTIQQNYQLLRELSDFRIMDCPILVGLSRKSMIYRPLNTTPEEALNGTTALQMYALQQGAHILRVHDVKAAVETIKLFELLK